SSPTRPSRPSSFLQPQLRVVDVGGDVGAWGRIVEPGDHVSTCSQPSDRLSPPPLPPRCPPSLAARVSPPPPDPPSAAAVGAAPTAPVPVAEPSVAPGLSERALVAITAALALPIFWLGYGTDIDVGQVLLAGDRIRNGDYAPSRNPGVPVVETIVGLLDPGGGHILGNLATVR